jgi:F-type H+-transporting ATPase subunit epsilon
VPPLYQLTVLAPDHTIFAGRASALVAPGVEGYLGVLARHAPMVVVLGTGQLAIEQEGGGRRLFAVSGGLLGVSEGEVSVLADTAEAAEEIDVQRAREAKDRADDRIRRRAAETDTNRAEAALRRALNRLRVAEKRRRAQ